MDNDGDGYGSGSVMACEQGGNMVLVDGDCDDSVGSVSNQRDDIAGDNVDQNCDGVDGTDFDGDGYASTIFRWRGLWRPRCRVLDENAGIDEDCDGNVDEMDDSLISVRPC